ncbi:MAG: RnfH family protein, partial [Deltaproteobacteria bacterium]|nr:RnfH family protein [Deltaproteobacteria bacterium]
ADRGRRLTDGDRVELYRPLEIDPREARRQLAEAGRTMRQGPQRDDQR